MKIFQFPQDKNFTSDTAQLAKSEVDHAIEMKEKILKELESRSSWTFSCNFWKRYILAMKITDWGQDPKKVPVIGLPYYIILMKLKKRVRHRGHPTKSPFFPIFRIFGREIGTAALKPQKLAVRYSQDFNIVEHTTSQWSIAPEYFHLYILVRFQRWVRKRGLNRTH